ncbi:MAG: hypothetical protein WCI65_07505 [Synechococcaceae cyanobacterium ELA263]
MTGSSQRSDESRACASFRVRFGLRPLIGLPVLMALGLGTLPARALPAASVQLFRINGNGVKTMPAISDALDRAQLQKTALAQVPQAGKPVPQAGKPVVQLVAQSDPASLVTPVPVPAAPLAAAAAPVAAAGISPLLILGAVIVIGVGVAAATGAFSGGGGGGGTNPSSQ